MGDGFSLEVRGIEELARALEDLPEKINRKILREALKVGAGRMLNAVSAACPRGAFHNDRAEGHQQRLKDSLKLASTRAGGITGYAVKGNYYGRYVEFGHILGKRPKGTKHRAGISAGLIALGAAHVPAKPFIRPAFERLRLPVIDGIAKDLVSGVERELARAARRRGGEA